IVVADGLALLSRPGEWGPGLGRSGEPGLHIEARGHNADEFIVPAVQNKLFVERVDRRAELAFRETVAENNNTVPAGLAFGFRKDSANRGPGAENGEEIHVRHRRENGLGSAAPADWKRAGPEWGHRFKDVVLAAPIQ